MKQMRLGASAWPFRWRPPFEPVMERVAGLGLVAVELITWSYDMLRETYAPADVDRMRRLAADLGLEISEFVATSEDLTHPDKERRDVALAFFADAVHVARDLGTGIINSVSPYPFARPVPTFADEDRSQSTPASYEPGLDWKGNWDIWVESAGRCVEACEGAGLVWAIEPHPHRYVAGRASMERLVDNVPSPALGLNLDVSHLGPMGEHPTAYMGSLGERIFHLHVSDNDGRVNRHWRPGRGKIDWDAVFLGLRELGYEGVISIELEDAPGAAPLPRPSDPPDWSEDATEEFDEEHRLSIDFLSQVAERNGVSLVVRGG
jgi:sugar phosphate isomerase/epimerase